MAALVGRQLEWRRRQLPEPRRRLLLHGVTHRRQLLLLHGVTHRRQLLLLHGVTHRRQLLLLPGGLPSRRRPKERSKVWRLWRLRQPCRRRLQDARQQALCQGWLLLLLRLLLQGWSMAGERELPQQRCLLLALLLLLALNQLLELQRHQLQALRQGPDVLAGQG